MNKVCAKKGHDWKENKGYNFWYRYCARSGCSRSCTLQSADGTKIPADMQWPVNSMDDTPRERAKKMRDPMLRVGFGIWLEGLHGPENTVCDPAGVYGRRICIHIYRKFFLIPLQKKAGSDKRVIA